MSQVYGPKAAESKQTVHATNEDRVKHAKQFKEQKAHEQKCKDERFAKIREDRKNRPGPKGGGGINIEVSGD